ncbi:MAG: hypothetical protein AVDCRST_MAG15-2383 [uncultured Rubellimicrobium sp.]|uniref:Uncharacterized protein n=1 Tax=uncultured Rubellimicrobium sp. TaxID=543078 RepID=A0A6J4PUV6_9RHOB|nr:MAG: hypothetical protein AVDCRST_MAG15-2383 [uncultured Rubellimicrobium sp.]
MLRRHGNAQLSGAWRITPTSSILSSKSSESSEFQDCQFVQCIIRAKAEAQRTVSARRSRFGKSIIRPE